ncbi:hypothetical protein pb186bvf_003430 [Paramecium bursaria]
MGNAVACEAPKKKMVIQTQQKVKMSTPTIQPTAQPTPTPKTNNFNCLIHVDEPIRAVCTTDDCFHKESRTLCCECLIESTCAKKLRLQEFVLKLRAALSKDAQDVFMELFDEKNQVKLDLYKQMQIVLDTITKKINQIADKNINLLITNYYLSAQNPQSKLNKTSVHQLELILENKTQQVSQETIDFAIYLITNRGMTEQLCEDIERKRNGLNEFATDFTQKFQSMQTKYIESLKFLFQLLITPMEYLTEDEGKINQQSKRQLINQTQNKEPQAAQKVEPKNQKISAPIIIDRCQVHQQEYIAVCVKVDCTHTDRKMCADCLIDTKCVERMKLNEFNGRVGRILNQEIIDQLATPWEDSLIYKNLHQVRFIKQKVVIGVIENVQQTLIDLQLQIVKDMFLKYHLIEDATPKDLKGQLSKEYFDGFMTMIQQGKVHSNNTSINLGVKFLNNQLLIEQFLGAIVKTEQILPKKADKLSHKIVSVTQLFIDKIQHLFEIYKLHSDQEQIKKQFKQINIDQFTLEESIYRVKTDGKSLSDWEVSDQIKIDKNVMDVCFVNEILVAIAVLDGNIIIYNIPQKKQILTLKHGTFLTQLRAFQFNGAPLLISSGFSNTGHSLMSWDVKSNKSAFTVPQAHNNSIRKIKYLHVNPSLASTFYSNNNNNSSVQLSSVSQTGSQQSIFVDIDEQLISCSDDGLIKLWKIDKNLKIIEEQILKQGQAVLDFTLLNGCILVSSHIDKTLHISLPFQSQNPFQQIQEESPIYSISPIDQIQTKKNKSAQQRFITGNERGIAKIYQWQNGRAVVMKLLSIHDDKITKISMLQPGFVASVSNDKNLALTLIQQAKVLTRLTKHEFPIVSFAYVKMNGMLVTADQQGNIILWK